LTKRNKKWITGSRTITTRFRERYNICLGQDSGFLPIFYNALFILAFKSWTP
jgi:hypothetical protein